MTDTDRLIERLEQGIDSVFDPDKGIPEAEAIMAEAAAALRKSEADLKAAREDCADYAYNLDQFRKDNDRQRETIGKLREALQTIVAG